MDGEARPVFKGSDVRTAEKECEPFGVVVLCLRSVGWAEAHAREALGMLRHWQPADVERSGLICAVVEGLAQSAHGAIRDAATALLYEPGAVAVPRVRLATRLEHAMTPTAEEFIVFWHHDRRAFGFLEGPHMETNFEEDVRSLAAQGLVLQATKPWYEQGKIGPHPVAVQYYLFGDEPAEHEPVGETLSRTFLCATLVYARCTRLDLVSRARKQRLLQAIGISAHSKGTPVRTPACCRCGREGVCDLAFYQMPVFDECYTVRTGDEPKPPFMLFVLLRGKVATRFPAARVDPRCAGDSAQLYDGRDAACVPPQYVLPECGSTPFGHAAGCRAVHPGVAIYKCVNGPGSVCMCPFNVAPCRRCGLCVCNECPHECGSEPPPAFLGKQQPETALPGGGVAEGAHDVERDVDRDNEEARERKALRKMHAALQPSLTGPAAVAAAPAAPGEPAEKAALSNNARRRREQKAKQRRAEQQRAEKQQRRDDDESRRILKQVDPLREAVGTVVKEDLETLESVQALEAVLQKEQKGGAAKPGRKLLGKMRSELIPFVESFKGAAPEATSFARNLLDGLVQRSPEGGYDRNAAEELYGYFADTFAAHPWRAPRLQQADRAVVLRAAALA